MAAQVTTTAPASLTNFCVAVIEKHAESWPVSEGVLAEEFAEFFKLKGIPQLLHLRELCAQLQIEFRQEALPHPLRGHNIHYCGKRTIFVSEASPFIGGVEHTLLHELRELLEYEFQALGRHIFGPDNKEELADEFAISVRMMMFSKEVPEWFSSAASIEKKWPRRLTYVLLFVGALALAAAIMFLPEAEEWFEQRKRKKMKRADSL